MITVTVTVNWHFWWDSSADCYLKPLHLLESSCLLKREGFWLWALRPTNPQSGQETCLASATWSTNDARVRAARVRDPGPRGGSAPANDRVNKLLLAPILRSGRALTRVLNVFSSVKLGRQKTPPTRRRAREQKAPTRPHTTYTETQANSSANSLQRVMLPNTSIAQTRKSNVCSLWLLS